VITLSHRIFYSLGYSLGYPLACALAAGILVVGCAADRLHGQGLADVERGDYESGVSKLSAAVQNDPHNMGFRLDLAAKREVAVQKLMGLADTARATGNFEAAAQDYRRVLAIDPANDRARHGLNGLEGDARHGATVAAARKDFERKDYAGAETKLRSVLGEDPGYTAAQELAAAITAARGPTTASPRLQTRDNRKVTLQFRDAPTKMVFEVLQRETGINFILDKDIKSDTKTTIFVQDVPVEQAIDLVLDQNALARQILAANMVMIYPNTASKQKEYEQQIVRTFYITNAEPKEVETMLKSVLGAKNMFIDERSGSLMLRDTPDAVRMAERLVASLDVAEPEVMLEVEVLEISSSKLQDLGILYPTTATLAPTPLGTAIAGATRSSSLVLSDLSHQSSNTITITPLSVTLNAMKQAGLTNTLASPRIRARNKEKAKVLIGSRLPVITNSVTPTAAGTPVVTGSVQYLDVGLTLEVQPTVHLDSDVAIKINLEVSSLLKQIQTASGTIAYEIGTRNANTVLRLKDGETQILAGLIQDTDTRTANKIPGLGDIPVLGHLFGTHHTDREKDEIVLSITPRIIRMQPRPASDNTEFWYGSESRTRTAPYSGDSGAFTSDRTSATSGTSAPSQYPPPPSQVPAAPASLPGGPQPVNPSVPASTVSAPLSGTSGPANTDVGTNSAVPTSSAQGPPITEPPAAIASVGPEPSDRGGDTAAPGAAEAAKRSTAGGARSALTLDGPANAKVGDEFQVAVQLSSREGITRLRSQLRFDAAALQLVSATVGDAVPAGANSPSVDVKGGGAQLDVVTSPEDPVQGAGSLMILRFKALAPRATTNIAAMLNVLGGTGAAVGTTSAQPLKVAIRP
jgi:general secretion pathway protein D